MNKYDLFKDCDSNSTVYYIELFENCKVAGPYQCDIADLIHYVDYIAGDVWMVGAKIGQKKYVWSRRKGWFVNKPVELEEYFIKRILAQLSGTIE